MIAFWPDMTASPYDQRRPGPAQSLPLRRTPGQPSKKKKKKISKNKKRKNSNGGVDDDDDDDDDDDNAVAAAAAAATGKNKGSDGGGGEEAKWPHLLLRPWQQGGGTAGTQLHRPMGGKAAPVEPIWQRVQDLSAHEPAQEGDAPQPSKKAKHESGRSGRSNNPVRDRGARVYKRPREVGIPIAPYDECFQGF